MIRLSDLLAAVSTACIPILDEAIPWKDYTPLDLSTGNPALKNLNIADPEVCQAYIDGILMSHAAQVAYGGYLEKRNLYAQNTHFQMNGAPIRNIHLGVDFWAKAGTAVLAPLNGTVHSFRNNAALGDYGPTILLQHTILEAKFYSLYGHLSLASLDGLFIGKQFRQGEVIGALGTPDINVNYAPHLHFQIIQDIGDYQGDYPGVCTTNEMEYYQNNCPNPLLLLHI